MSRAWVGFARMLLFVGFGIAVLAQGWKRRHARREKSVSQDYLLLIGSAIVLATILIATLFWTVSNRVDERPWKYLFIGLLLTIGAGLTYVSNRVLRSKGKGKG